MANQRTFGRRAPAMPPARSRPQAMTPQAAPVAKTIERAEPVVREPVRHDPPVQERHAVSHDYETGHETRHDSWDADDDPRRKYKIPWRPIYFMASICFGLASFVLPDSINNIVEWPLYALMAASFYAGMRMRREKRAAKKAAKAAAKEAKASAGA